MSFTDFTVLDIIALVWFLACWIGFGEFSARRARSSPSLVAALLAFRREWMRRMREREHHQSDATILNNLLRGALFFASTSIFVFGGLVALLGTAQRVTEVFAELPFTAPFSLWLWEMKVLMLIYIFVYAFFKFTWSAWQYNALSIVVGAAPAPDAPAADAARYVEAASGMAGLAGESFNRGVRAYYFSMAAVTWFLHPLLMVVAASWVTYVIYRREFGSATLAALQAGAR